MWRPARKDEDEVIVRMCLALYTEDPGQPVARTQICQTLEAFRAEPGRGRAVMLEVGGELVGYALLAAFWLNEYGGEICIVDELYVECAHRNRGLGTSLFDAIFEDRALWPREPVALELEVTPSNTRARSLYERLGFGAKNITLRKPAVLRGVRAET
jgi:GNAT superfamily N-acetyltransferase